MTTLEGGSAEQSVAGERGDRPVDHGFSEVPTTFWPDGRPMPLSLQRIWFPTLRVRQWTGHVQGVAVHWSEQDSRYTVYTSLSDFPRGWGGLLINDNDVVHGLPVGMESSSLPQGNHPGGIGVADDLLVVPIEGGRKDGKKRDGRLYVYDISERFYPIQKVSLSDLSPGGGLVGRDVGNDVNRTKASAAGIARLNGEGHRYLIVVLSQERYLRFVELNVVEGTAEAAESTERAEAAETVERAETGPDYVLSLKHFRDGRSEEHWPTGFTDNVSLVAKDDQVYLFLFSVRVRRFPQWLKVPGYGALPPLLPRPGARHFVTVFEVDTDRILAGSRHLDHEGAGKPDVSPLTYHSQWPVVLPEPGRRDWLRPGFRWGASAGVYGDGIGVATAEYFGNERSPSGDVQYLQFATSFLQSDDWFQHHRGTAKTDRKLKRGLPPSERLALIVILVLLADFVAWIGAIAFVPFNPDPLTLLVRAHIYVLAPFGVLVKGVWDWITSLAAS